jgi:hypothetical protein
MKTIEAKVIQKNKNTDGSNYYLLERVISGFVITGFLKTENQWELDQLIRLNEEEAEQINWKS